MALKRLNNFIAELRGGQKAEKVICDLFNTSGLPTMIRGGRWSEWDLETRLPGYFVDFYTEVKYDKHEAKSGNLAFELFNPKTNKPSGLGITSANLWCHVLSDSIWIANVQELKNYIKNNEPYKKIMRGGDNNARLRLYEGHVILPAVFHRLDTLKKKQLCYKVIELWKKDFLHK